MQYRTLGSTGERVSIIGLGCEHLDNRPYEEVKPVIDAALEYGVNILDVFMPGAAVRENIRRALGDRRDQVLIQGHIGSTDVGQQYDISRDLPTAQKYFEELLRLFGTIDFGMMFFVDSEEDYKNVFETEFVSYVQRLKQQGDIRHIGFSSHNPETAMKAIQTGVPEMLMFSINPAFDMLPAEEYSLDQLDKGFSGELMRGLDPRRAALYKLCDQKRVGITVMKTLGAGKLLSREHSPYSAPLTVEQCIHYALTRPGVASALIGCKTPEEVQSAMGYLTAGDAEKDYAEILRGPRNNFQGNCVYCNHCQPCPAEIDIAAVNKYLDIARLDRSAVPPSIRSHYRSLQSGGGACVECGSCEERCPFGVPVIENMREAAEIFGE
ncbi:MAG: aldo/keto reductase [Firmicutes bacterium]|nr:aldo/keto reductase [Bacillota bacterium]